MLHMEHKMSGRERSIRKKLRDNFIHYANKCLKIRTKSGAIEPLVLNKAQLYIHEKLEAQKGATGKVRALVLKGRQQGCCLSPDTRVLTAGYQWVKIEDLRVGEKIIACNEGSPGKTKVGKKKSRQMLTATVEAKAEFWKPVARITLDNGAEIEMTLDHRMLCKQRGGDVQQWREAQHFKIGDQIRVATRPPEYMDFTFSYEDGWFGGLIDGEGSWREIGAKRLSISQCEGPVLQKARQYLKNIGIPFCEVIDSRNSKNSTKLGDKPVHRLDIHRMPYIIEILARCRPVRFVDRDWHSGHELPGKAAKDGIKPWAKIINIEFLGTHRVIDIQTSEKTFIAEGLVSHNSTYVGARFYHRTSHSFGMQTFILTHALDATANLYKMAQRYHQNTPLSVRPQVSTNNSKELIFGLLDSGYKIGTAENKAVGRSSTIQLFHGSEVGFWANADEHAKGILQAIPDADGTEVILESTANGVGNYFHEMWQRAEAGLSDYIAIFVPWYWQEEYARTVNEDFEPDADEIELIDLYGLTHEQLAWRRIKIQNLSVNGVDGEKAFKQEYPCNSTEAFQLTGEDSYIDSSLVLRARKHQELERVGPVILTCDPARFGDDRTAIIRRCGRVVYGLESYSKKDTMEVTGILNAIIKEEKPHKVCIDVGGLGAGIVDRLRELGHGDLIVAVNAGSKPLDAEKYYNKRAEMWGELRQWLTDLPCSIPDNDALHADLCGLKYKVDSNSRLRIESKEDAKKRGIRSPDLADAICLSFALPSSAYDTHIKQDMVTKKLASNLKQQLNAITRSVGSPYA